MIPPKANAAFVAAMEDVLEVYTRPHDPARPLVCLDETSKQLVAETRAPLPMLPGQLARHDYEYERKGTANLFMLFAPLEGWRHVEVTDRRTAIDYAKILKDLSDTHFQRADKIVLVQDNLNTHSPASLYEAFAPDEARRLFERFEWHYTPKHGSWLDLAESELAVLSGQCLDRRIPDRATLEREVACLSFANPSTTFWYCCSFPRRAIPLSIRDPMYSTLVRNIWKELAESEAKSSNTSRTAAMNSALMRCAVAFLKFVSAYVILNNELGISRRSALHSSS